MTFADLIYLVVSPYTPKSCPPGETEVNGVCKGKLFSISSMSC